MSAKIPPSADLQEVLRAAQDRLHDFLELSTDWAWETDAALRFTWFSSRLTESTGVTSEQFLGRTPEDLMGDRKDDAALQHLAALRLRKPFRRLIHQVQTPRGERRFAISGKPILGTDGAFCGYRGTGSDITDALEAEHRADQTHRKLAERTRELERVLDNMTNGIIFYDADEKLLVYNKRFLEIFNFPAERMRPGLTITEMMDISIAAGNYDGSGRNREEIVGERLAFARQRGRVEFTKVLANGRVVAAVQQPLPEGGLVLTYSDISERKRYERELERSNAELEQFAYVASHDLQEPLRMVASYCQLLQRRYKGKLDQDADEFIGYAVEGAQRMQRLINDLLAYSRIGQKGTAFEPVVLSEVVEAALANLRIAVDEAGATVETGNSPTVRGNRTQLTQLFQNLIGNAIKFRRDEPPVVRIAAHPQHDGATHIVVEDNGMGIEPEYLDRVFLIFQRLHERGRYPGTGIGLAVAKKVVEHHGGRIWIESTPGQGSRFHLTLPSANTTVAMQGWAC
jgi:PAS domain S-box-containing protein